MSPNLKSSAIFTQVFLQWILLASSELQLETETCTPSWFLLYAGMFFLPLIGKFVNCGRTNWLRRQKVLTWIHYTKCLHDLQGLQSSRTNLAHFHCKYGVLNILGLFTTPTEGGKVDCLSDNKLKLLRQHFYFTVFIPVAVNFRAFIKTQFNFKILFRLH